MISNLIINFSKLASPRICDECKVPESSIESWLIVEWLIDVNSIDCSCQCNDNGNKTQTTRLISELTQFPTKQKEKKLSIPAETHPSYDWIDVKTDGKENQMMVYLCATRNGESQSLVNLQMIRFRLVFVRIEYIFPRSLTLLALCVKANRVWEKKWDEK